ncbi:MAG: thiamine pyrophosphate-dependent dehydrogenase E1 component subunit alpha, partial [Longimicrobiales bacterium]
MATKAKSVTQRDSYAGLGREQLLRFYRIMVTARRTDDQEILLKRQNKIFFQISGAGHEAVQVAIAEHLRPGSDWFYLYYRDRALSQALGMTPYEHLLQAVGAESDPASGGRQMPAHWGHRDLRIVSVSSPTGTQFLQSVGCAETSYRATLNEALRSSLGPLQDDEIVLCTTGEGQTSEGEFWEALNTACNLKLPVVFLVEDNGYAISVPVEVGLAGGKISRLVSGFPGLYIEEVDGCDVIASYEATGRAVQYARTRRGPALVHAQVVRPYSHSMSDDERSYRSESERQLEARRDPIVNFRQLLIEENLASEEELGALDAEIAKEVQEASDRALEQPQPAPETAMLHLFSPDVDPTSKTFDTEDQVQSSGGD